LHQLADRLPQGQTRDPSQVLPTSEPAAWRRRRAGDASPCRRPHARGRRPDCAPLARARRCRHPRPDEAPEPLPVGPPRSLPRQPHHRRCGAHQERPLPIRQLPKEASSPDARADGRQTRAQPKRWLVPLLASRRASEPSETLFGERWFARRPRLTSSPRPRSQLRMSGRAPTSADLISPQGRHTRKALRCCRDVFLVGLLVGLFVGLFCQPASGFWRFVAVDSLTTESAQSPITTGSSRKSSDAGGGTRTPDTRIMIPLVFPVFAGDSADFGRHIGLFCQATCTNSERALAVNRRAARRCRTPGPRRGDRSGRPCAGRPARRARPQRRR
jgi:hypothetical protein